MKKDSASENEKKLKELFQDLAGNLAEQMFRPNREMKESGIYGTSGDGKRKSSRKWPLAELTSIHDQHLEYLQNALATEKPYELLPVFREYNQKLEKYLTGLPEKISTDQNENRFRRMPGDPFLIRCIKWGKSARLWLQSGNKRKGPGQKRKEGKPPAPVKSWKHEVPIRLLNRYVFRNLLHSSLLPLIDESMEISNLHCWNLRQQADESFARAISPHMPGSLRKEEKETPPGYLPVLEGTLDLAKERFREKAMKVFENSLIVYRDLFEKAGTAELPAGKLKAGRVNRKYRDIISQTESIIRPWNETLGFMLDDWKFKGELDRMILYLLKTGQELTEEKTGNISETLDTFLKKFKELRERLWRNIEEELPEGPGLTGRLEQQFLQYRKEFSALIMSFLPETDQANIPLFVKNFPDELEQYINGLPPRQTLVRSLQPGNPVRKQNIRKFPPADILRYAVMPPLRKSAHNLAAGLEKLLEELTGLLEETGKIIEFSLETAMDMSRKGEKEQEEILETLKGGIERSSAKEKEIKEKLSEIRTIISEQLNENVSASVHSIQSLKEKENLLKLRMKIARARIKQNYLHFFKKLKDSLQQAVAWAGQIPEKIAAAYGQGKKAIVKKLGYPDKTQTITTELSDFLSEGQTALEKLPYIYQRIYQIQPLEDESFFTGREKELERLEAAIRNWEEGKYSPVVILGEKGSGISSLLNLHRKKNNKYPSHICKTEEQLYESDQFIELLSEQLEIKKCQSAEELIDTISQLENKFIVYLEDLQRFYLRKVDGFTNLKLLFEIISRTQQKVMWITSCTRYAWNYLNKTIHISSFFGYVIPLEEIDPETMNEVIRVRNRISGYKIVFLPNKIQENNHTYRKLTAGKRQEYLEKQYFQNLNRFAESNISLALIFWLRSTRDVREKSILITSLYEPDYTFMSTLGVDQILTITNILLHNGLTENELSEILRKSPEYCRMLLLQLFDDGLLERNSGRYFVNPLIYRQAVKFLQSKNFIH